MYQQRLLSLPAEGELESLWPEFPDKERKDAVVLWAQLIARVAQTNVVAQLKEEEKSHEATPR
jgi:hypothetical protein